MELQDSVEKFKYEYYHSQLIKKGEIPLPFYEWIKIYKEITRKED